MMKTTVNKYRFKFYLNARHGMVYEGKVGNLHPHTWEICIIIKTENQEFFKFSAIEKSVDYYISRYDSKLLNNIKPFNIINPTMENLGKVMYKNISKILNKNGWELLELQISENPTRTYFIDEYIEEMDLFDDIDPLNYNLENLEIENVGELNKNENLGSAENNKAGDVSSKRSYTRTEKMKIKKAKNQKITIKMFIGLILVIGIYFVLKYFNVDLYGILHNFVVTHTLN